MRRVRCQACGDRLRPARLNTRVGNRRIAAHREIEATRRAESSQRVRLPCRRQRRSSLDPLRTRCPLFRPGSRCGLMARPALAQVLPQTLENEAARQQREIERQTAPQRQRGPGVAAPTPGPRLEFPAGGATVLLRRIEFDDSRFLSSAELDASVPAISAGRSISPRSASSSWRSTTSMPRKARSRRAPYCRRRSSTAVSSRSSSSRAASARSASAGRSRPGPGLSVPRSRRGGRGRRCAGTQPRGLDQRLSGADPCLPDQPGEFLTARRALIGSVLLPHVLAGQRQRRRQRTKRPHAASWPATSR